MIQRASPAVPDGLHVALVMDGNGRWAERRGLPRVTGHRAGAAAARRVVEAAPHCGIGVLSLYAFSADNWRRPPGEVSALFRLLGTFLRREVLRAEMEGVRVNVVGRRDRLPAALRHAIDDAERRTRGGGRLLLRLAVDYSARDAIRRAAACCAGDEAPTREAFAAALAAVDHAEPAPPVDLLVRAGGEQRLSDFLLWESAYAELLFLDTPWPDFGATDLAQAVEAYRRRERRFGGAGRPAAVALRPALTVTRRTG